MMNSVVKQVEIPPICSSMHENSPTTTIWSVLQEGVVVEEVGIHLVDIYEQGREILASHKGAM